MKKFYLLLTLLLVAFVSRATEASWTFKDSKLLSGTTDWKFSKTLTFYNYNNDKEGVQIGSSNNPAGKFTMTSAVPYSNVSSVSIKAATGKSGVATVSVSVNGKEVNGTEVNNTEFTPTSSSLSTTPTTYEFTGLGSGNVVITFNASSKAMYLGAITITYTEGNNCATPTFSVPEGTYYGNAGETLDVALPCATPNSIIKYTVNGEEKTYNGTNIPELVYPGTYEVVAWATADGLDPSAKATATYKLVDKATLTKFTKVTNASNLKAGDKVIIVCESKNDAMSNTQGSGESNRGTTKYEISGADILETGDIQVITLEDAPGGFYLNLGDGKYLASTASKNLSVFTEKNNQTIWTISVADGVASIHCIANTTAKSRIEHNSSSNYYTVYDSTQTAVQLYYSPAPAAANCADPTFSISEGTYYGFKGQTKEITLSCSTEGATIMYSTDGENYKAYEAPITITCPSKTTISAYAMKADGSLGNSATVSKTYNYVDYPSVASIAEFKTHADATKPYMFTCPLTVTYQNGNRLYLRDEAGDAILVYGKINQTYSAGNQLPANKVVGTYKVYNQMVEIIPVEGVTWPESDGTADASPVEMTIAQLNAVTEAEQWSTLASKLVVIKGAKVSADGSTITVGEESFTPAFANRFKPELTNANCVYDIVGIIETHWNTETKAVDGIQFCQTAYLDNYSPEKMYMIGYIQSINQDWHATQGIEMAKEAAGRYSANVNLTFNDWFAVTSRIANDDNEGGWAWVNGDRYAYTSGVFGKVATDYVMTQGDVKTQVFWAGNFKVTVDYYAKTISFVPAAGNADGTPDYSTVFPEKLRIVGEIADGEWAAESIVENHLATRGEDGYTYTFNELQFVKTGKFRLTTAWDATNWDGSYSVNGRALKAATDAEPRIKFGTVANILPFTSNDLVADVQKSGGFDFDFANLQLIVNLKDMTVTGTMSSGVSQIKVGGATVTATNGTIRVDGGNTTSIYNIAGQAIALGSKAKEFSVARGMYIVNVDGKATKVVVR